MIKRFNCVIVCDQETDQSELTRKWTKANDSLGGQYSVNKNIRFKC